MSVPIHELDTLDHLAVDLLNRRTDQRELDLPIRQDLATLDPDVAIVYERLVIAREGTRRFVRGCLADDTADWLAVALRVDDLLARAQRAIEGLR